MRIREEIVRLYPFLRGLRRFARLLRVNYRNIPAGQIVSTRPFGLLFLVHPDDVYFEIFFSKTYERHETELMSCLIKTGDTVFDIGANFGWFAVHALRVTSDTGTVWAFEPQEAMCEEIVANCARNGYDVVSYGNTRIFEYALGDKEQVVRFYRPTDASHALAKVVSNDSCEDSSFEVAMKTVDELTKWLPPNSRPPSFIKCDVEGGELNVLRGSANACASATKPIWMIEVNRSAAGSFGWKPEDMIYFLEEYGYSHFVFMAYARKPQLVWERSMPGRPHLPDNGNLVALSRAVHFESLKILSDMYDVRI